MRMGAGPGAPRRRLTCSAHAGPWPTAEAGRAMLESWPARSQPAGAPRAMEHAGRSGAAASAAARRALGGGMGAAAGAGTRQTSPQLPAQRRQSWRRRGQRARVCRACSRAAARPSPLHASHPAVPLQVKMGRVIRGQRKGAGGVFKSHKHPPQGCRKAAQARRHRAQWLHQGRGDGDPARPRTWRAPGAGERQGRGDGGGARGQRQGERGGAGRLGRGGGQACRHVQRLVESTCSSGAAA